MVEGWARLEQRRICACACLTWNGGVAVLMAVVGAAEGGGGRGGSGDIPGEREGAWMVLYAIFGRPSHAFGALFINTRK